ncbi:MAG: DUF4397 domain-containing protein [Calditrichaeota bacterium]|nr:DUF4397 domain-containing protein [Calditrichota bacterium]MCB9473692.1 DUF4397 domain-containing protein [Candidatus Delongbacteria bacterium]
MKRLMLALACGLLPLAAQAADLRVAHLSPDAPNVDVWLDSNVVLSDVPYGAFSPYLDIADGSHLVQVFVAGTNMNPVIDATLDFAAGSVTTVAATGLLSDNSFGPILLEDTRSTDANSAWLRFVHTVADAPAVDITLADGTVIFSDVAFNQSIDYTPVAPGDYSLQVRVAGTETVVLAFEQVSLSAATTLSVFATGKLSDGTLGALASVDAPGTGSDVVMLENLGTSLRVAHLSPDAPAVDVYFGGAMVLENVSYPAFSNYLDIPSGPHGVQVFVSGTNTDPVIDATLDFAAGSATTVAATGLLADQSFGPVVLEDSRLTVPAHAWARFVHTAADAPAVDITLADGTVIFGDVAFNGSSAYLPVSPGNYSFQVRLAGTETVVLSFAPVELMAASTYSIFATGTLAAGTLGAWASVDAPGSGSDVMMLENLGTSVRVAHLSPDAPAVDVYLNEAMVLENVGYPAFSPYLDIPAGTHHVQVFVSGTSTNPVIDEMLDFQAGSATTVAATGLLGNGSFGPMLFADSRLTSPTQAWVRFAHTAADAPAVDITLTDGTVVFGNVAFNESAAYLPLDPGGYDLQVRVAGTETVVMSLDTVELDAAMTYSVFATGTLAGDMLAALATVDAPGDGSGYIELGQTTSVATELARPSGFRMLPASPNPFNPTTRLSFELDAASSVRLSVYNVQGQMVARLLDGQLGAGVHSLQWNASSLASGRYLALLEGGAGQSVQPLTLVK